MYEHTKLALFFFQEDCAPCDEKKPLVDGVAGSLPAPLRYVDARAPENAGMVARYRVKATPTVVVVTNDEAMDLVGRAFGFQINEEHLGRLLAR